MAEERRRVPREVLKRYLREKSPVRHKPLTRDLEALRARGRERQAQAEAWRAEQEQKSED